MFKKSPFFVSFKKSSVRKLRTAGDVAQRKREWSNASEFYQRYLDQRPNDAPIWIQFGHALKELRRFSEAEAAYRSALRAAPNDDDARLHLVALLRSLDRQDEAIQLSLADRDLNNTLPRDTPGKKIPSGLSTVQMGDIARDRRDWLTAASFYGKHLSEHLHDGAIWVQLGHMLKESSLFEEALYAYQLGKRFESQATDVSIHLASLLMHMGRSIEATPLWADMFQNDQSFFLHGK